jgi:hypothetical protein
MCAGLVGSTSGYYEWRGRAESATALRRGALKVHIVKIFTDSDETYGHRRGHAERLDQFSHQYWGRLLAIIRSRTCPRRR